MSLSLTKKAILTGYAHSISLKGFETNRLFLVTAAGIISGIPVFDEKNRQFECYRCTDAQLCGS